MWVWGEGGCGSEEEEELGGGVGTRVYNPTHIHVQPSLTMSLVILFFASSSFKPSSSLFLSGEQTNTWLNKLKVGSQVTWVGPEIHTSSSTLSPPPSLPLPLSPQLPFPTWVSPEICIHQVVDNVVLANSFYLVTTLRE